MEEPNIFTEFGSFTVGESGAALFSIINQKQQNDRESWYMIDSSFMTTLPDIWGINQRYPLLAINNWDKEYQRVFLGGLSCDSEDYYSRRSTPTPSSFRSSHPVRRSISVSSIRGLIRSRSAASAASNTV